MSAPSSAPAPGVSPPGPRFALIGAAGYIAPRHMAAVRDVNGTIAAALDHNDCVGILDSYFPMAAFFTELESLDHHLNHLRASGGGVDYVSICSPNYLHDAHIRFALHAGADAICEKPLVLDPADLDGLQELEQETGRRISTIMQLRLHPNIVALKRKVAASADTTYDVDLTYVTSRGPWFHVSWKGDEAKSGGISTDIGIHFFDMLAHVFGAVRQNVVHLHDSRRCAGYAEFARARVRWFLSVDAADLPAGLDPGQPTWRAITVGGERVEFSGGFEDLHTENYRQALDGHGFGIADARPSIEMAEQVRCATLRPGVGARHPGTAPYL